MGYFMTHSSAKSRLAKLGTASALFVLAISGTVRADVGASLATSGSRTTTAVDISSVSVALASKESYGTASGYKWGERELRPQTTSVGWASSEAGDSGYKWSMNNRPSAEPQEQVSHALGNPEESFSAAQQAGYRWGIRNVADQAGYRWGIRNVADQAGYRWGIRNVADQAGYRWGIRNVADQAGYRWGIRNVADQAGYRWGIRNVADQAGYRWGIRNVADQAGYRWGIR